LWTLSISGLHRVGPQLHARPLPFARRQSWIGPLGSDPFFLLSNGNKEREEEFLRSMNEKGYANLKITWPKKISSFGKKLIVPKNKLPDIQKR
jgi:hypothetical protein